MRTVMRMSIVALLVGTMAARAAHSTAKAQPSGAPLCDAMVDKLRNNADVMSGKTEAWSALTKGDRPFIETAAADPMEKQPGADQDDNARRLQRFRDTFSPSEALAKRVAGIMGDEHTEVQALKDSGLHTIWSVGGTAHCLSFWFFQTFPGRSSELVPDVPPESDRDGENVICESYGSSGYLARVNGVDAFIRTRPDSFRIVPLQNGKWTQACSIEAKNRTVYGVEKLFAPPTDPVSAASLRAAASQIAEQHDAAKDPKAFTFGPPAPERDAANVRVMLALAKTLSNEPIPTWGHDADLGNFTSLSSADSYPLVLDGHTYLLRIGTSQLGCCYVSDPILVLYTLKDGKLDGVASALISKSRGPVESLRATLSR